jgi:hypothetical protein
MLLQPLGDGSLSQKTPVNSGKIGDAGPKSGSGGRHIEMLRRCNTLK